MSIITLFLYKIKLFVNSYREELGVILIIIMVAFSSYYLGKYSVLGAEQIGNSTPLEITDNYQEEALKQINNTQHSGDETPGQVVASKTGKRYYLPWCAAAERISPKNKIYFASAADAMKAGLTPASNCKGMK